MKAKDVYNLLVRSVADYRKLKKRDKKKKEEKGEI
jgi:hypothetical protein